MAAQALSFSSNFWSPSSSSTSSLQHQQNQHLKPNSLSFQQRKRPRRPSLSISPSSNLLFSNTTHTNPNPNPNPNYPNSFNANNPFTPIHPQNNNNNISFFSHQQSLTTTDQFYGTNTFFDTPSPQALIPPDPDKYCHQNYLFNGSLDLTDPITPDDDFLSLDDQKLLASFLAESPCDHTTVDSFTAPQGHIKGEIVVGADNCQPKKPNGTSSSSGSTVVSPQSIAARERRRKISEKTAQLGKLVPGGNKMSTAEMFQAAYKYVKFLKAQVSVLQLQASSNQEMKNREVYVKEMQVLASPVIQETLYSQEKCLVPREFHDRILSKNQVPQFSSNSYICPMNYAKKTMTIDISDYIC